jgi:hypothetical protein
MKTRSFAPVAPTPETPVFGKKIRLRPNAKAVTPPKSQKRHNIFSKSRDTREDRGTRQAKTSHNAQTLPHGR